MRISDWSSDVCSSDLGQSRRGNRLFDLGLGEVALAFTAASSKTDQSRITELVAEHGRGGFAQAWLHHRGLEWAADLLAAPDPAALDKDRLSLTLEEDIQ